jgi:hypothetical protein
MKAVGYIQSLLPSDPTSLFDFELPTPRSRDLLVSVRAAYIEIQSRQRKQASALKISTG